MKVNKLITIACLLMVMLLVSGCQENNQSKYENAQLLMGKGKYTEAAKTFDELGSYEDSPKLSLYCKAADAGENGDYQSAISTFTLLNGYSDSNLMISYYHAREFEVKANSDEELLFWRYWISAADLYDSLSLFKDSKERAEQCREAAYNQAEKWASSGNYSLAIQVLETLGDYNDCNLLRLYYQAFEYENDGEYLSALECFTRLGEYKDSKSQASEVMKRGYSKAESLEEGGDPIGAYSIYISLGEFEDAHERAQSMMYSYGEELRKKQDWDGAVHAFEMATTYSDAATQVLVTKYEEGIAKLDLKDWEGAEKAFLAAGEYKDAASLALETLYLNAADEYDQEHYMEAYQIYNKIPGYKDVKNRLAILAGMVASGSENLTESDNDVILYYNPNGGTKYHLDQNCKSTHAKYLPMKGTFYYSQINDEEYVNLKPCNVCNAPAR